SSRGRSTAGSGGPSAASLTDPRQHRGPFLADRLESTRMEPEELQDRGRYRGRLHPSVGYRGLDAGRVDDDRDVTVAGVVAAVLGDLGAAGVHDPDLYASEHVGVARIRDRHPEETG